MRSDSVNRLKLVIFDLDDTLLDTSGQLDAVYPGSEKAKLLPGAIDLIHEIRSRNISIAIVSTGNCLNQEKKLEAVGFRKLVDAVFICELPEEKLALFERCLSEFSARPQQALVVGDRIDREIEFGRKLGCVTVRVLQGRHSNMIPTCDNQVADFTIQNIAALRHWFGPWLPPCVARGWRLSVSKTQEALRDLPGKEGEALVRWYVQTMKSFGPKTDAQRKRVLEWISRELVAAASNGKVTASSVIDHFFSPIGLGTTNMLLPKYPPVLESLSTGMRGSVSQFLVMPASSEDLLKLIIRMSKGYHPFKVRVAGGAGGGKTAFAKDLVQEATRSGLRAKSVGMDAYAFSRQVRQKQELEGLAMYEWDKVREMTTSLCCGKNFRARVADRGLGICAYEMEETDPSEIDLFLFEGILTLAASELAGFDLGIYIDEEDERRFLRRLERDRGLKGYSSIYIAWTFATTQLNEFRLIRESAKSAQIILNYKKGLLHVISSEKMTAALSAFRTVSTTPP